MGRCGLTTLLAKKISSVERKYAILILLLVTRYRLFILSDPNPDPALILKSPPRRSGQSFLFNREEDEEEKNLPNHVPECTSKQPRFPE